MGTRNPERYTDKPDWHTHRTLGEMKASGWRLATWCTNCGHGAPVDIDHLIELRGTDASPWDRYVVCGYRNCRGRAVFKAATGPADLWYRLSQIGPAEHENDRKARRRPTTAGDQEA